MARRISFDRPAPFRAPRIPQAGRLRRVAERKGLELRPLAGPEIPMPPEQDQALADRAAAWMAAYNGSLPEFIVYEFLTLKKKQREGLDFLYQNPIFGGRTSFGGYVADFVFPQRKQIWNVLGLRWHLLHTEDRARDLVAKQMLTSRGYLVLSLWEDSLLTSPDHVLELAWQGMEEVNRNV